MSVKLVRELLSILGMKVVSPGQLIKLGRQLPAEEIFLLELVKVLFHFALFVGCLKLHAQLVNVTLKLVDQLRIEIAFKH